MKPIANARGKLNRGKRACAVFALCAATSITLRAQTFTTIYSFCVDSTCTDGDEPAAGLVQGTDGNFYGTTPFGGAIGNGTVFKITPSGTLTTIHSFGVEDGIGPITALVQSTDGNFYGTTEFGGPDNDPYGTIFKITPSGTLTTLYGCGLQDCFLSSALVQATDGDLYGTTPNGEDVLQCGECNGGSVFKITQTGTLTTLYSFCSQDVTPSGECPDGFEPNAALIQGTDGNLYGTTTGGGAIGDGANCASTGGCGTVFRITPSGSLTTLYTFCAHTGCTDGGAPSALIQGTDGNFYGTTSVGGANCASTGRCGTFFRITPSGSLTTLGTDAGFPEQLGGILVEGTDGNFYGIGGGGANSQGTIFEITPSGALTTLHSFCSQNGCTDGKQPAPGLIQATDGNFYGTTAAGGGQGQGAVFRLSVGLNPFVNTLPSFGYVGAAVQILGTNLTGATSVTFDGTAAVFTVVSPTLISTTVPAGAATGAVQVTTPSGKLLSKAAFLVEPPFTVALSTAGQAGPFAAESIVSAYGASLATGTTSAPGLPLPTSLADTTVTVTDSAGVARMAPLFYVSPVQINFEIPEGTALGTASVSIQSQGGTAQTVTIQIGNVSPGLFELNSSGLVAAWALPVISGTQQPLQPVYFVVSEAVVPLPINLGSSTDQFYLEMYGTGIRNANNVTVSVGGLSVPVLYAGPAPGFEGEDQVNIGPLPPLLFTGSVDIVLAADGQAANTVVVAIQAAPTPAGGAVYTYKGYGFFFGQPPFSILQSARSYINGYFITSTALAPNLEAAQIAPDVSTFQFTDGVNTLIPSDTGSGYGFLVSTDAQGNIIAWDVVLMQDAGAPNNYGISTCNGISSGCPNFPIDEAYGDNVGAYNEGEPGTWSVVSTPAAMPQSFDRQDGAARRGIVGRGH